MKERKGGNKIERIFACIRYAMDPESQSAPEMREKDWLWLFDFADEQAISGVMFDGRRKMADEAGMRDDEGFLDDLTLEWGFVAHQVEEQNKAIYRKCVEVQKELQEAGFQCCILKGHGNALMYPNPFARMSGDIDVWVKMDDGRRKMDDGILHRNHRKEILRWAREHKEVRGCHFQHVEYEEDGIGVELHFIPCSMNNPMYHRRLQKWFREKADQEDIWHHEVELPHTESTEITEITESKDGHRISVPTVEFNMVYQLAHMMHHFFDEGIGLRQMMDYYYVLMSDGRWKKEDVSDTLRYLGLWKFVGAVMYVMREVFHLEEQYMIAPVDERRGETLMEEILKGGNFGHYSGLTDHSMAVKYFLKIKRNMRFVRQYPAEALCEPVFRTWHFFWRLSKQHQK